MKSKGKTAEAPVSMEVYRQLIFDVAMDLIDGGRANHPNEDFAQRLIDIANRPVL